MKINITRIDPQLPLPEYKTHGAIAFDIYSREQIIISSGTTALAPSNLIIQTPKGYGLFIFGRSSLHKKGLMLANNVGLIDRDYCGPEDEIKIALYKFTEGKAVIEAGERIAQGVFLKVPSVTFKETTITKKKSRGGFGSTGK